jgi:hypothetical protein
MATRFQHAHPSEPFRWKLFVLILIIMGSITTAAIVLTLLANPPRGSLHLPTVQPITRLDHAASNVEAASLSPADRHASRGVEFRSARRG